MTGRRVIFPPPDYWNRPHICAECRARLDDGGLVLDTQPAHDDNQEWTS